MISCWSNRWCSHVCPPVATAGLCASLWLFEAQVPTITWPKATFKKWQYGMTRAIEKKCLKKKYIYIFAWYPNLITIKYPEFADSRNLSKQIFSRWTRINRDVIGRMASMGNIPKWTNLSGWWLSRNQPHACMHAYIHTCIHTCMHACIHASIHACMHAYIVIHSHT